MNKNRKTIFVSALMAIGVTTAALIAVAQQGQITLKIAGWAGTGATGPAVWKMINDKFTNENPGIRVEYEGIQNEGYPAVLRTRVAGGDAPDAFESTLSDSVQFFKSGLIADLSKESWVKEMNVNARKVNSLDGKTYQLVLGFVGVGMLYNQEVLDQAGVKEVPANFPELLIACDKIKAIGKTPFLIGAKDSWGLKMLSFLLAANTVYRTDPNFDVRLVTGKAKVDSPSWRLVFSRIQKMSSRGCFNATLSPGIESFNQTVNELSANRVAFVPHGSWSPSDVKKANPTLKFAFGAFPGGSAGSKPYAITLPASSFVVNAKGKNTEAARKYLAFLARQDVLKLHLQLIGAFSPRIGDKNYQMAELDPFSEAVASNRSSTYPFINIPGFEDFYGKGLQDLIAGKSPAEVARYIDAEYGKKK